MTNRESSNRRTGTSRAQEIRLEQDGQTALFPTRRHGAGTWGGYRAGSGRKPPQTPRRGHSVYVTDQEWRAIQELIQRMRSTDATDTPG